jgi:DNA-nicking Smr family endonuclease
MDFGEILNEWDKIKKEREDSATSRNESGLPRKAKKAQALEAWLDAKGIDDKDSREDEAEDRRYEARRLDALKPQATLDLHGMTSEEAESAIVDFIGSSAREGLEKVLVIHGKGLHSEGGRSVLKKTARRVLESHPLTGRIGEASRVDGGSGALWVLIKRRKY